MNALGGTDAAMSCIDLHDQHHEPVPRDGSPNAGGAMSSYPFPKTFGSPHRPTVETGISVLSHTGMRTVWGGGRNRGGGQYFRGKDATLTAYVLTPTFGAIVLYQESQNVFPIDFGLL